MTNKNVITITAPIEVPAERVANCFIGGMESGYSPWFGGVLAKSGTFSPAGIWYAEAEFFANPFTITVKYDSGEDDEGSFASQKVITNADLPKALALMAQGTYATHFGDLMSERDDAETHDVFMQFLILGEVIYG